MDSIEAKKTLDISQAPLITHYRILGLLDNFLKVQNDEGKEGFINLNCKDFTHAKPIFIDEIIVSSSNERLVVEKNWGGYLLINQEGQSLSKEYYAISHISSDLYKVYVYPHYCGVMNKDGKEIIKCNYYNIVPPEKDLIIVYLKKKLKQGNIVKKFVLRNEKIIHKGLYDISGKKLLDEKFKRISIIDNKTVIVTDFSDKYYKVHLDLINNNHTFEPFNFDGILNCDFYHNVAIITNKKKYGLIDTNGRIVLPLKYDYINPFICGYAICKLNDKYGLINMEGKEVLKPTHYQLEYISAALYMVDNLIVKIEDNKVIHFPKIDNLILESEIVNNLIPCFYKNYHSGLINYGLVNMKGKLVIPINDDYLNMTYKNNFWWAYKRKHNYDVYSKDGVKLFENLTSDIVVKQAKQVGNLVYSQIGNTYTLVDLNGHKIFENIVADQFLILNDDLIIVDNHILKLSDIKEVYSVDIEINNSKLKKTFDTLEKQKMFIQMFNDGLNNWFNTYINNLESKINEHSKEKVK